MTEQTVTDVEVKPVEATPEFIDQATRDKQERERKKEMKKAEKKLAVEYGDKKLAKKMVKQAVKNINIRRAAGRGR
jgi:ABC-type methionine transport system ATPase subunit